MKHDNMEALNDLCREMDEMALIRHFTVKYQKRIALASSLGPEDQVLTHMLMTIHPETTIFTLDTGRLFPETYDLLARTNARYHTKIVVYFPDKEQVEDMVNEHGINLFYDSIGNRKRCCQIRKVEPLKRAFTNLEAWICGLRSEQSVTRRNLKRVEWDGDHQLIKINPLADWTDKMVWDYIREHRIPYNTLHDKGFPSIGCQPCTRAVEPGEDQRAGRWWWENPATRECGLHKK